MSAVDNTTVGLGDVGSVGATGLLDETGVVLALTDGGGDTSDAFMCVLAMGTRFSDAWVLFVVFDTVWTRRGDVVGVLTCSVGARDGVSLLKLSGTVRAPSTFSSFMPSFFDTFPPSTSSRFSPFPLSTLYIGASTGCAAAASCTTKAARKAITAFRMPSGKGLALVCAHCCSIRLSFASSSATVLTVPFAIVVADVAVFDETGGDVAAMGPDFVAS
jgi:hypothetical protein